MGRPICYDHADLSIQKCTKIPQQFMSPPSVHKNSYENNCGVHSCPPVCPQANIIPALTASVRGSGGSVMGWFHLSPQCEGLLESKMFF